MSDDSSSRARFATLLDVELLVPTPDPPSVAGACEVVEPEQLLVAMHEDDLGLAFPAFTSAEAFLRWQPAGGIVARRLGRVIGELAAIDEQGRVVIDAGSSDELVVGSSELRSILVADAVGADPAAGEATGHVLVAASSDPLDAATAAAVGGALRSEPAVLAAHLVVIDDGSGGPGRCIALELLEGVDPAEVMPSIVEAVADAAPSAASLTFTVVAGELAAAVAASGSDLLAR